MLKKSILKIESTTNHVWVTVWYNKLKQLKSCKKDINKELMPVAWDFTRWCNYCMQEDEKNKI